MSAQRGSAKFEPRARIIKLLGEELITNEVIAIVELVKNSFDADATKVTVDLEKIVDVENAKIRILDNGVGMSLDTVLNAWLQPGTEVKKKSRERKERTAIFHRPILGEKGVGRFAAQKLGRLVTLITRAKGDEHETLVEVNWKDFEQDKLLSEIPVNWIQAKPIVFKRDQTGTLIEINFLHKKWTHRTVRNLAEKLATLQSPFGKKGNFEIELISNDFPKVNEEAKFPKDVLKRAVYSFSGTVSKEGILKAQYRFLNPVFKELQREFEIEGKDVRDPKDFKNGRMMRQPSCGGFGFEFYVWDLDPSTMRETISREAYLSFVRPHKGIRIYRDDFRVWPYGKEGNDWLELDRRRVNNMPKCLSNNQIIGIVEISHKNNPSLTDKTDREGLIENIQYSDFRSLVLTTINELEILRRQDKTKIDNMRERKVGKKIDATIDEIEKLRRKILKNGHLDIYATSLKSLENAHNNYKINVVEKLYVAAGIGIAALMPAHEVQIQLKDLRPILTSLKNEMIRIGFGGKIIERFDDIDRIINILWDVSHGALELTKREHKSFSLRSVVDFSIKNKRQELERNGITIEIQEKEKIAIKGYANLVMTAIMNLLDNSIWWLQKSFDKRKLKITIKRDTNNFPNIIVSDNGPGIDPADLPFLGDAFYTRKPKGTGLGLFISNRCMEANSGRIDFGFYPHDPDYLQGANVHLIFEVVGD